MRRIALEILAATAMCGTTIFASAGSAGAAPPNPGGPPAGAELDVLSSPTYGDVLVTNIDGVGPLPLYAITSDRHHDFGCPAAPPENTFEGTLTCTGPESDFITEIEGGQTSDEWPAFTTNGPVTVGSGVVRQLVSTVNRPGIGRQVTYAGHPLYLFDGPSDPFAPVGEGFFESTLPLPPWHGLWDVVSADNGQPAAGDAQLGPAPIASEESVLSVEEYPNVGGAEIPVYEFGPGRPLPPPPAASGPPDTRWIPVLSQGTPQGVEGLGTISTPQGDQVTYDGMPLYLYAYEGVNGALQGLGNGQGQLGPGGVASLIPLSGGD